MSFNVNNNNLDEFFQAYFSATATATQAATLSSNITNYSNILIDINKKYAGRDNRSGNEQTLRTNYSVNTNDLNLFFNKINSIFEINISGSFTYFPNTARTPLISYSPSNVVVPGRSNRINAGTYTGSTSDSTNTVAVGLNIPSTYVIQRSGTMIISPYAAIFTFSGSNIFDGVSRPITNFISNNLPSGITYSVTTGTNPIRNVGTYSSSSYTISITNDLASNYTITRTGNTVITPRPVSFIFSGGFTFDGVSRPITDFISNNLPSGITYSVTGGTNPITNVGSYNSNDYSIIITNDLIGNYTISKSGQVQIEKRGIRIYVFGQIEYTGNNFEPFFYTEPDIGFGQISLNSTFRDPGIYNDPQNWNWIYDSNNIHIDSYTGSFEIFVNVTINISGSFGYNGQFGSYFPFYTVSPSQYTSFIEQSGFGYTNPGRYFGSAFFNQFSSSASYIRIQNITGYMDILVFSGTIDLTQTVNSNGIGNLVSLVSNGSVSPFLPGNVSYSVTNIGISDDGGLYPKYVSATNGNCSYSIIGDNQNYYNLTITGTITILAPLN
jgi:hypothetical protein